MNSLHLTHHNSTIGTHGYVIKFENALKNSTRNKTMIFTRRTKDPIPFINTPDGVSIQSVDEYKFGFLENLDGRKSQF